MKISEYFFGIQGEGMYAGVPSLFIRTAGCVLRCQYCDTKFSWKDEGDDFDSSKIINDLKNRIVVTHMVITGGEPLMKKNHDVLRSFLSSLNNFTTTFETTMLEGDYILFSSTSRSELFKYAEFFGKSHTYVISPKLDPKCYPFSVSKKDIFRFYQRGVKGFNAYFKIVYNSKNGLDILDFLGMSDLTRDDVYIMPMTSFPFNRTEYIKSCESTAEFCLREGLRYSPRIHIDIWEDERGK